MLDSIIRPFQGSFIPGRGTTDNALLAQEIMHHIHKSKSKYGTLAAEIDLEKAYDRVNWGFLEATLEEFGFPEVTVKLKMHCVKSASLALLWNGSKLPSFIPTKGLDRGDPMSPYLFVICMEKLSCMIEEKVREGRWEPVRNQLFLLE
jgi:hypothetical protein